MRPARDYRRGVAQAAQGRVKVRKAKATQVGDNLGMQLAFSRDFESDGNVSLLRLRPANLRWKPLLIVPRLVCGLQPDCGGDDVERAVPNDKASALGIRQKDEAAALRPHIATGLTARAPLWRNAGCRPRDIGLNECGVERRNTALVSATT